MSNSNIQLCWNIDFEDLLDIKCVRECKVKGQKINCPF